MPAKRNRTHPVGFDPTVLKIQCPRIGFDPDEDTSDDREKLRCLIWFVFASDNEDALQLVVAIVNFHADGRVIRRDGTNQQLAQLLGVSEGQASRRFRELVGRFDLMASEFKQFAANLGKARPELTEHEMQMDILWKVAEGFRTGRESAAVGGPLALYRAVREFRHALLNCVSNYSKVRASA